MKMRSVIRWAFVLSVTLPLCIGLEFVSLPIGGKFVIGFCAGIAAMLVAFAVWPSQD